MQKNNNDNCTYLWGAIPCFNTGTIQIRVNMSFFSNIDYFFMEKGLLFEECKSINATFLIKLHLSACFYALGVYVPPTLEWPLERGL